MFENAENIRQVRRDERIEYKCTACGQCCRNVRDSIALNPYDIFRLVRHFQSKHSNKTPQEIIEEIADLKRISRGYSVYVLKTVSDSGVCVFLEENKCSQYEARPMVCRAYPFLFETTDNASKIKFFLCTEKQHHFYGSFVTPRKWRKKSISDEEISFFCDEANNLSEIGRLISKTPDDLIAKAEALVLSLLCFAYNFSEPFLPQYKENIAMLKAYLRSMTH